MRWKLIERPRYNSLDITTYRSADDQWTLCKEFYAAGPSLFSWMLYRGNFEFVQEFNTKKAASTFVDAYTEETP